MTEEEMKEFAQYFQSELIKRIDEEICKMLYSELSLSSLREEIEHKPIEIEFTQDYFYYNGRYLFNMPYPKRSFIGFMNICS